jgi:hypothetical protein
MSHNVWLVCDAAPSLTEARGRCGVAARRSAAEPEPPEGRRCTYVLLYAVAIIVSDERDHTAGLKIPGNESPG